jgi:hypothetical protein
MTDAIVSAESKLKTAFAAAKPQKQIAAAEAFISTIRDLSETGSKPTPATLKSGEKLLNTLEQQAEVYLFQAAVLAGQEAGSEGELDRKVQSIGKEAERVETTTRQLRSMLQSFA